LSAQQGLAIFSPVLTSKVLAQAIETNWKPGAVIEDNGDYEAASSVNFYTHRQLHILNGQCNNIWYGSKFPDAPPIFDNDASFTTIWNSDKRVFLLTDGKAQPTNETSDRCPQEDRLPSYIKKDDACVLARWGGKLLITNERKLCPGPSSQKK